MKQQTLKAIVPALAVAFIFCSCIFSSCEKCELESDYTIHFSNDSTVIRLTGDAWTGYYTPYQVSDIVISNMRSSFKSPNRVKVVPDEAEFKFIIDSISTFSNQWIESELDPCYDGYPWLYRQFHPQETYTYYLNSAQIKVYARLIDTLNGTQVPFAYDLQVAQYLSQPTDTSGLCHQYQVTGEGYPYHVTGVGQNTGNAVCQVVKSLREL